MSCRYSWSVTCLCAWWILLFVSAVYAAPPRNAATRDKFLRTVDGVERPKNTVLHDTDFIRLKEHETFEDLDANQDHLLSRDEFLKLGYSGAEDELKTITGTETGPMTEEQFLSATYDLDTMLSSSFGSLERISGTISSAVMASPQKSCATG